MDTETPAGLLQFFYSLIDDEPDTEQAYMLMDAAYTKRNDSRMWRMLLKLDTSINHSPGNTWLTEKSLPEDFAEAVKLFGGEASNLYEEVPFEDILSWKDSPSKFAVDIANLKARFTGAPSQALTMYLWYKRVPPSLMGLSDADKESASVIVWPKRFRKILPFDMASAYFGGIEADEITRQQVPYLNKEHQMLVNAMISWDTKLALRAMGGSATATRSGQGERSDVVDW